MSYDHDLADRVRGLLQYEDGIAEKAMFGGLAFLSQGYMFVGIQGQRLMARVGTEYYEAALAQDHVREMDFTGQAMRGYVYIEPPGFENDVALDDWVQRCLQFVQTLPAKPAKD